MKKLALLAGVSLGLGMAVAPAQAQDLADRFGDRGSILSISMSPDGKRVAYLRSGPTHEEVLNILDLEGDGIPRAIAMDENDSGGLRSCDWANDRYLICYFVGSADIVDLVQVGFSRLLVMDAEGGPVRLLTRKPSHRAIGALLFGGSVVSLDVEGKPNSVLLGAYYQADNRIGTKIGRETGGVGVEEVDLTNLHRSEFEKARNAAAGYLADENGEIRIMATVDRDEGGYDRDTRDYAVRNNRSAGYELLIPDAPLDDLYLLSVETDRQRAIGLARRDGFREVVSVALDGSGRVETLLRKDQFDIDRVLRIGRRKRVIGASFATTRRHYEYFEPEFAKLASALEKALPDNQLVEIIDSSSDERRLLILTHSDRNPGRVYLLDRDSMQLTEIAPIREALEGLELATSQPVSFPASDGTEIPAYLTLPPGSDGKDIPAIVMPHGGPQARDEWGFDWIAQYFALRGYAVIQPNFRGSDGYGDSWVGSNALKDWKTAIGDVRDAGHWLVSEGIARENGLVGFGWSYGGYAVLQSAAEEPDLFQSVVAVAPVTDLELLRDKFRYSSAFKQVSDDIGHGSSVSEGSPARRAADITAPILLAHGTLDANVPYEQSEAMERALRSVGRDVEFLSYPNLAHGLQDSSVRAELLRRSDAFFRENLDLEP